MINITHYKSELLELLKKVDKLHDFGHRYGGRDRPVLLNDICSDAYNKLGLSRRETKDLLKEMESEGKVVYHTSNDVRPTYIEDQ